MVKGEEDHLETFKEFVDVYRLPILLGGVSLLCIAFSLIIFVKSYERVSPILFRSDEQQQASVAGALVPTEATTILVDIEGAVDKPGVYRLSPDAHVDDALRAAGGFTNQVDQQAVARSINRAAKLSDGAKLYIPFLGEERRTEDSTVMEVTSGVNINSASQSDLEALSGIGPVTAGKIIAGRPYLRLEELVEKKAMSQSLFDKLKEQLTL